MKTWQARRLCFRKLVKNCTMTEDPRNFQRYHKASKCVIKQGKTWNPAVVTKQANTPRSFILQCPDGSTYRRQRKHIINLI